MTQSKSNQNSKTKKSAYKGSNSKTGTAKSLKSSGRGKSINTVQTNAQDSTGLGLEIAILTIFALSIWLFISNFELGGAIGTIVSKFFFGIFGWMAYIFPIFSFFVTAFYFVNRKNRLVKRKMAGIFLGFLCLLILIHMLTVGYTKGDTLTGFYKYCSVQKTGGGILGGGFSMLFCTAFGKAGTYVILFASILIAGIIITQKPILAPIKNKGEKVYKEAREKHERKHTKATVFNIEQLKLPAQPDTLQPEKESTAEKPLKKEEQSQILDFQIHRPSAEELFPEAIENNNFQIQEITPEEPLEEVIPIKEKKSRKNPKSSQKEIHEGIEKIQNEIEKKEPEKEAYVFPPVTLLKKGSRSASMDSDAHVRETALKLQTTLHNFGVNVTVTDVSCGPTVTRYELQPEQGVKVSKIVSLSDDIKLNLAATDIRIEAPIPGKAAIGIEVPNETNSAVMLRDLLESKEFLEFPSQLAVAVGKDIAGKTVVADIGKMPHLLIAGATGSGKSVCINTLILSLIYKSSPEDVKLIMIDPKVVELSVYNGIPHLFIPVVTDPKKAAGALNWAVAEMTDRYNKFAEYNVRDLKGYNEKVGQLADIEDENKPKRLPKIVIIVDELADLMMVAAGEVEDAICRLAQLARAAGIHLVIATQRPSVDVITGLIKANMPSRIAFKVSSSVDSRTILDMNGAEKLLGNGDMLYYPQGYSKPVRLQGSYVSDSEVGEVVKFLSVHQKEAPVYDEKITEMITNTPSAGSPGSGAEVDTYFVDAGKFIIEKDKASIGMLQRVFKIGFNRAARIMDQLSEAGVVGPEEGTKPRKVLMTMEEFENYIEESL